MRLLISCSFVLVAASYASAPAQRMPQSLAIYTPNSALIYPLLQTHMVTKHRDVPQPPSLDQLPTTSAKPKIKSDPVQLQREARALLELAQSVQLDIDSLNHGLLPKDTIGRLKRIEKLSKHLRGEISP